MQPGLENIAQSSATDKQAPIWNDAADFWEPADVVLGLTSADSSVDITDNGDGTLDLAAIGGGGDGAVFSGAKVTRSAAYNLVNNSATLMPWDAETYDTDGFHDNATNNTRFTVPSGKAGKYSIKYSIGSSATGVTYTRVLLALTVNGATIPGGTIDTSVGSGAFMMLGGSVDVDLAVGDYVELVYYQNSGAVRALDTTKSGMSMHKIDSGNAATSFVGCKAIKTSSQGLSLATFTAIQFDGANQYDTNFIHDSVTNNTRFTVPAGMGGVWTFSASVGFATGSSTRRTLAWAKNGTQLSGTDGAERFVSTEAILNATLDITLAAGDYIELLAESGVAINVTSAQCSVSMRSSASGFFQGLLPLALAPGYASVPGGTVTPTGQGKAVPITLPGPMNIRGLVIECSATGTGTVQWGLFYAGQTPSAATKVAGGSGTLSATGATMIAATGAPVSVLPGAYILVVAFPATNCPGVQRATTTTSPPWNRVWTSYTWSDTPDLTSASWAASNTMLNLYLKGDLTSGGVAWW